jgi:hypothetical protein
MSHLFISYAHADKAHLDRLVTWLRENDFAEHELWYDKHIEGGNNWRDEIASALDEAFGVLVIVTSTSVKSLYCTYEWAYAMGQGIPTLPLVFDKVEMADVPTPLTSKQFTNCVESIPDYLKEQVTRLKSVPPPVAALNKMIYETILDTHRRFFILGWLDIEPSALEMAGNVFPHFISKASEAHQVLQTLMVDKGFVFTRQQYRLCWKLMDFLQIFSKLRNTHDKYFQEQLFSRFEDEWLPIFEYFEYFEVKRRQRWRQRTRRFFDDDLQDEFVRMEVMAEIMRAFPDFDVDMVNRLVNQ